MPSTGEKIVLGLNNLLKNFSDILHDTSGYKESELTTAKLLKLKYIR